MLGLTGWVVSIPVFCDSGFVILSSLAKEFSRLTKKSMVGLGGILGMGLYITHFMVPPTPGPLAVVSTFQENGLTIDLGIYILCGIAISVPLFIFSVPLFRFFGRKYPNLIVPYEIDRSKYTPEQLKVLDRIHEKYKRNEDLVTEDFAELLAAEKLPSAFLSFATLLVPILLIFANTLVSQISSLDGTLLADVIEFLGQPVMALFISLCMGAFLLCSNFDKKTCINLMQEACRDAGPIVFITAAGGALGAVINATGAAKIMADAIVAAGVPGILIPTIIGVIMRFPQGSGTTAMITGSAIVAPMLTAGLLSERFVLPRCHQLLRHGHQDQPQDLVDRLDSDSGIRLCYFYYSFPLYSLSKKSNGCRLCGSHLTITDDPFVFTPSRSFAADP